MLHELLFVAGIDRPFIFVGHSKAAFYMQVYHHIYPEDVAAVALIDARHPDTNKTLGLEDKENRV